MLLLLKTRLWIFKAGAKAILSQLLLTGWELPKPPLNLLYLWKINFWVKIQLLNTLTAYAVVIKNLTLNLQSRRKSKICGLDPWEIGAFHADFGHIESILIKINYIKQLFIA